VDRLEVVNATQQLSSVNYVPIHLPLHLKKVLTITKTIGMRQSRIMQECNMF
jgi:hypothetical protein